MTIPLESSECVKNVAPRQIWKKLRSHIQRSHSTSKYGCIRVNLVNSSDTVYGWPDELVL
jgi:hypothetical protein